MGKGTSVMVDMIYIFAGILHLVFVGVIVNASSSNASLVSIRSNPVIMLPPMIIGLLMLWYGVRRYITMIPLMARLLIFLIRYALRPRGGEAVLLEERRVTPQVGFGLRMMIALVLAVPILLVPFLGNGYLTLTLTILYINIIVALSFVVLTGYTGLISIGQTVFMAVGAYVAYICDSILGLQFIPSMILGALSAAGVGILLGLPSFKLRGFYLAVSTLAGLFMLTTILYIPPVAQVVGTYSGITMPPPRIGPIVVSNSSTFLYYVSLLSAVLFLWFTHNIKRSRFGRAFIAIRDNEIVASLLGINVRLYKLLSFAISSFYAGFAGALLAYTLVTVVVGQFALPNGLFNTIQYLAMSILGGVESIWGAVLGPLAFEAISQVLQAILFGIASLFGNTPLALQAYAAAELIRFIVSGALLVVTVTLQPEGLVGILRGLASSRALRFLRELLPMNP
jgi:branched-chain amino acid transport system permease protein